MEWTLKCPQVSTGPLPRGLGSAPGSAGLLKTPSLLHPDGTLPVQRRRKTHAFGGGDHQSCLKPLTEDDSNDGNESEGDAGRKSPPVLQP